MPRGLGKMQHQFSFLDEVEPLLRETYGPNGTEALLYNNNNYIIMMLCSRTI